MMLLFNNVESALPSGRAAAPSPISLSAPQRWFNLFTPWLEPQPTAAPSFSDDSVRDAFHFFDKDGSGYIDATELHIALKHYGIDLTEDEAREVLSIYNINPDGQLDPEEWTEIAMDAARGMVVATTVDSSASAAKPRWNLFGRGRKPARPSDEGGAGVCCLDELAVDADLLFDRLEAGARLHFSTSLEPLVTEALSDEAALRGREGQLAKWKRNGQLHCAPEVNLESLE